jgi:hypothetical protein
LTALLRVAEEGQRYASGERIIATHRYNIERRAREADVVDAARGSRRTRVMNIWYLQLAKIVEFASGVCVFLLGLWMWFLTIGESKPDALRNILLFVIPGLLVAAGSSVQTTINKLWALVWILLGSAPALYVSIVMFSAFRYYGRPLWVRLAAADFFLVLITLITSLIVAFSQMVTKMFPVAVPNKSLDASGGHGQR